MVSIALYSVKGGVSKSVGTVNIAAILSKEFHKRVLVLDVDMQANATDYLAAGQDINKDLVDYINSDGSLELDKLIMHAPLDRKKDVKSLVDFIPGSSSLGKTEILNKHFLRDIFRNIENSYDYVLCDCPGTYNDASICVLNCVDFILVPTLADIDALKGYDIIIDTVNEVRENGNLQLEILGVYYSNIEAHHALDRFIMTENSEAFEDILFHNYIRRSAHVPQARTNYKPICYYKPSSPATIDYIKLTDEIITRADIAIKKRKRKKS